MVFRHRRHGRRHEHRRAAPVIARVAKEMGALMRGRGHRSRFYFEGKRSGSCRPGHALPAGDGHSIITIPNDRLLSLALQKATFLEDAQEADESSTTPSRASRT